MYPPIVLPTPPVIFDPEAHTYHHAHTGQPLSGITSTLLRSLKPDKYSRVPQAVLAKAAQRGHAIHAEIELMHTLHTDALSLEAQAWRECYEREGFQFLESEYIVSDLQHFASAIDLVFQASPTSVHLADIKTTAQLDRELVAWQLSIYAHLFEQQCGGVRVERLYAIHLRGDRCQLVELPRRSAAEVEALITAYLSGKPLAPTATEEQATALPTDIAELLDTLTLARSEMAEWKAVAEKTQAQLAQYMDAQQLRALDTPALRLTRIEATERNTLDSARLKAEQPELYAQYLKTTLTQPSLKLTLK